MKKLLICLLILGILAFAIYYFRDPILDLLPIDQSGWRNDEGTIYYLDEDGDPRTGWVSLETGTYFFREDGVMHTGWLEDGENRYFLNSAGQLQTGWQTIQGNTHYFDAEGKLRHGFLEEEGKRFYLDENGSPDTGVFSDGETHYFVLDNGSLLSGWITIAEGTYYLEENGALHTGWLEDAGKRYYFGEEDGVMVTGWADTPDGRYFFSENGTINTGLVEVDGVLRGFDAYGAPLSGWAKLDDKRYYFNPDGTLYQGWLEEDGKRYYIREDGTAAVGRLEIDGETYFFSSTGMNFIMVNPWNALPDDFSINPIEACGTRLDETCREALEKMFADCRAAGYSPHMVSGYRSIGDQRANLNRMVNSYINQGYGYEAAYAAATQIVAVPGTSEHHLGLAFDIVDIAYPKLNHQQATMPTQQWLMEHCWEYGFILRYPENSTHITGIIWEPWHYRYVGVELAQEIRDLGGIPLEVYIDSLTGDGSTCGGEYTTIEDYLAEHQ